MLQVGLGTFDDPDPCGCDNYNVNCKNFEETDRSVYPFDRDLPVGSVEHWRVSASFDGHPFHIHINPFLVCPKPETNLFDPLPFPHWRDTVLVNGLNRPLDLVTEYRRFAGAFVFHCHKLTHEDEGMMELLRTCDPATDPSCGAFTWDACADEDLTCVQKLASTQCAIAAETDPEAFACITDLGAPDGVCGINACSVDEDCLPFERCRDYVCSP